MISTRCAMKTSAVCLIIHLFAKAQAWIDYSLVFSDVNIMEINNTILSNASMWLSKFNRTTTVLNLSLNLLYDVEKDIDIGFHATEIITNRPRETPMFDTKMDVCKFFENRNETNLHKLINIFYDNLVKYGNFPTSCPFRKGNFYLKDMLIDDDLLPPYFPGDKWKFFVSFYVNNVTIFSAAMTMLVDRTVKLREALRRRFG